MCFFALARLALALVGAFCCDPDANLWLHFLDLAALQLLLGGALWFPAFYQSKKGLMAYCMRRACPRALETQRATTPSSRAHTSIFAQE